ncbi:MAG: nuclear transport factor 2 family protein [Actinomycetales bacterium]|nr:nuclear transport factor 2 family protein [Actinomycetales bacterium]
MTHPFRAAVEARDLEAVRATLADDVVFFSPVAFQPFQGSDVVTEVLGHVMDVFSDFAYTDDLAGDGTHALVFRTSVNGKQVEGLDHLVLDADGRVARLTVMLRPLSGVIAMAEAMGPRVAHLPKSAT